MTKTRDQNIWQLFIKVRYWNVPLALWNSAKYTTINIMESIYTLILSVFNCQLECLVSESEHNCCKKLAHKQKMKILELYKQLINTGPTSFVWN